MSNLIQSTSLSEYLNIVEPFKGTRYFRGQSAKYNKIIPSLFRNKGWMKYEYLMIQELKNQYHSEFDDNEVIELFKMQHYGLPTRILDLTSSPIIALFFAVSSTTNTDSNIFIINGLKESGIKDISTQAISYLATLNIDKLDEFTIKYNEKYKTDLMSHELKNALEKNIVINDFYAMSNERAFIQNGLSLLFGYDVVGNNIIKNKKRILESKYIEKTVTIPSKYKHLIKSELNEYLGVNDKSVLVSLEKKAQIIKQDNEHLSDDKVVYDYDVEIDDKQYTCLIKKILLTINLKRIRKKSEIRKIIKKEYKNISKKYRDVEQVYGWIYVNEIDIRQPNYTCYTYWFKNKNITKNYNDRIDDILIKWNFDADSRRIKNKSNEISANLMINKTEPLMNKIVNVYKSFDKYVEDIKGEYDIQKIKKYIGKVDSIINWDFADIAHGSEEIECYYKGSEKLAYYISDLMRQFLTYASLPRKEYAFEEYMKSRKKAKDKIDKYVSMLKKVKENI